MATEVLTDGIKLDPKFKDENFDTTQQNEFKKSMYIRFNETEEIKVYANTPYILNEVRTAVQDYLDKKNMRKDAIENIKEDLNNIQNDTKSNHILVKEKSFEEDTIPKKLYTVVADGQGEYAEFNYVNLNDAVLCYLYIVGHFLNKKYGGNGDNEAESVELSFVPHFNYREDCYKNNNISFKDYPTFDCAGVSIYTRETVINDELNDDNKDKIKEILDSKFSIR